MLMLSKPDATALYVHLPFAFYRQSAEFQKDDDLGR